MKLLSIILFQCLFLVAIAQTGTIHVKKNSNCDFEFVADTSLLNKMAIVGGITIDGTDDIDFMIECGYASADSVFVSKEAFENNLKKICDYNKYKITKIEIATSKINPSSNSAFIKFTLIKN